MPGLIDLVNRSGIYIIYSVLDGRSYIGSSRNISERWKGHLDGLGRKKHHNHHLQNFFNKYGEKILIFDVLEFCKIKDLLAREQWYLDTMKPEFNSCGTAGSPFSENSHGENWRN